MRGGHVRRPHGPTVPETRQPTPAPCSPSVHNHPTHAPTVTAVETSRSASGSAPRSKKFKSQRAKKTVAIRETKETLPGHRFGPLSLAQPPQAARARARGAAQRDAPRGLTRADGVRHARVDEAAAHGDCHGERRSVINLFGSAWAGRAARAQARGVSSALAARPACGWRRLCSSCAMPASGSPGTTSKSAARPSTTAPATPSRQHAAAACGRGTPQPTEGGSAR